MYPQEFLKITDEIDLLMRSFSHTKKDIGYGYRRTFDNGQWFDIIDYKKKGINILRVGRGAWLVRKYPILHSFFDEVMTVIAKLKIHDISTIHEKHIIGILNLLNDAPQGIGAFD